MGKLPRKFPCQKLKKDILDIAREIGEREGYKVKRFGTKKDESWVTLLKQSPDISASEFIMMKTDNDKISIDVKVRAHLRMAQGKAEKLLQDFKEKLLAEAKRQEISEAN
jgi:hypothetical protein